MCCFILVGTCVFVLAIKAPATSTINLISCNLQPRWKNVFTHSKLLCYMVLKRRLDRTKPHSACNLFICIPATKKAWFTLQCYCAYIPPSFYLLFIRFFVAWNTVIKHILIYIQYIYLRISSAFFFNKKWSIRFKITNLIGTSGITGSSIQM